MIYKYKEYYVGVDVGGTTIKFGIFGLDRKNIKKLITQYSFKTQYRKYNSEKLLTKDMLDSIDNFFRTNSFGITKNKLKGIGFAIPGPVVNNRIIRAVNINWKKNYNLEQETKKRFGKNIKVLIYNDANAAAIGEYKFNIKNKYKSVCLFTLGTAVGAGIIIDGKIIEGRSGIAGELSHLKVDYSESALKCKCGNIGCLETVAGGRGIANVYNMMYKTNIMNGAKDVISLAKKGDAKAMAALTKSLDYLSMVIVVVMLVYEPEAILIGGGVSNEGSIITNIIKKQLKNKVFITKVFPKILLAKLKNNAGIYGSVANL